MAQYLHFRVPTQEALLQSVLNSLKTETDDDSDSDGISVVKTEKTESLKFLKKEIIILDPQNEDLDLGGTFSFNY